VRKLLLAFAVFAIAGGLVACGDDGGGGDGDGDSAAEGEFQPIQDNTLTVATDLIAPGFWDGDDPASITGGMEYDMAVDMADRLGLENGVEVVNVSFNALVAGRLDNFDIALSQVTITDERAEVVDFTIPYFESNQGIMVLEDSDVEVNDLEDAQSIQWGVQNATTSQIFLTEEVQPDDEPRAYQETDQLFNALRAGQIDAVLLDTAIVVGEADQPDSPFEVIGQFRTGEAYGGILVKGSPNLEIVDGVIQDQLDDGTIDQLIEENLVPNIVPPEDEVPFVEI
jgi:polar amino acid transport system substrate-binding protein